MQDDDMSMSRYVCPRTRMPLHLENGVLRSTKGQIVEYPLISGIPQFLCFEPAENEKDIKRLERLNQLARESGWESALRAVHAGDDQFIQYVTDPKRASFIELLPLTRETDVLEIGPGLGQFTAQLARQAKSVCALEVVAGQAEFSAERCRQEGMNNVHLAVGGDDCRLPYADASFDLVVLNLVFEWCASRCVEETHNDVQRRLLAEMYRVLRPGGSLYLATKNRFALRYVIGKPDEHFHGMRFGSALPQWLASCLLRLRGLSRMPGKLFSYGALKAMLRNAGFERIDSFWATPEMRYPVQYVPTDAASIREARRNPDFIQGEGRSTRLLMRFIPAPLVKYFTPGLAFLATKHF